MTSIDWPKVAAWTRHRHLLDGSCTSPEQVLNAVLGIYHFEPTGTLSVLARSPHSNAEDVTQLQTQKRTVRIPAMRGSVFLVPTSLAAMLLSACNQHRRRPGAPSDRELTALTPDVLGAANWPRTVSDLATATGDSTRRGFVEPLCDQGLLLRLSFTGRTRYVATEAWLGQTFPVIDRDEALSELALHYLKAYGPASVTDFTWWTGLPPQRCCAALNRHELIDVGDGLLLPAEQQQQYRTHSHIPCREVLVLPRWDALTMGYSPAGRHRLLGATAYHRVYDRGGDGAGVVLGNDRVTGTWQGSFAANSAQIVVHTDQPLHGVNDAFVDLTSRLGKQSCTVRHGA